MSCEWPVDDSCLPVIPDLADDATDEQIAEHARTVARRQAALGMAADVLWALSGRQFGKCPVLARPCPQRVGDSYWRTGGPVIMWDGDDWLNVGCGCAGRCVLTGPRMVHLPGPVAEIVTVTIGGQVIDPAGYKREGNVLYRVGASWPSQDLSRPLDEAGTWSVEYLRGVEPPAGVATLTGLLAAEFDKACSGDGKCRLPRNVTAVTRQGISYQLYDPQDIYANGKTGLAEVDMWLASVNPNHLQQGPVVL
ncbi:head-to-tail adaptor [Gordonia phage NHagos]|nr:head-to-tail adaptor [Gordonia phage NHagos]